MKITELRVGNFIVDDEGEMCRVTGFTPYGHSVRCDENEGCIILIDTYNDNFTIRSGGMECESKWSEPIPITEEWLERFGFKRFGELLHFDAWSPGHPSQRFDLTWSESLGFLTKSRYQPEGDDFKMRHIQYIHQLQNLYFALTGEELTIKA